MVRQEANVRLHTSQILTANQRLNWRQEAAKKQVLVQFGKLALGRNLTPTTERVEVTAVFTFPTKRARDRANYHPTVKALLDGIVRAGVLVDDSDAWIEGPNIVITDETSPAGSVLVTFVLEDVKSARLARLREAERQIMAERAEAIRAKAEQVKAKKR